MVLRVLIVDDEPLARLAVSHVLRTRDDVEVVGEADSVASAARAVESHRPDVIFLDVKLPDGSGFDLFDRVEVAGQVVLLTAFSEHALRAFEFSALDYVVKPIDKRRVHRALDRALCFARGTEAASAIDSEKRRLQMNERVPLRTSGVLQFALLSDIVFIGAANDYTEIHLASGSVALVSERLRNWEARLPRQFVRIHRSAIVNLGFVEKLSIHQGSWRVHLRNAKEPLTVSRRNLEELKARLQSGG